MPREPRDAKADRLLVHARVTIQRTDTGWVDAVVRGDTDFWEVTYRRGSWSCSCPARGLCAHRVAVGRVVSPVKALRLHLPATTEGRGMTDADRLPSRHTLQGFTDHVDHVRLGLGELRLLPSFDLSDWDRHLEQATTDEDFLAASAEVARALGTGAIGEALAHELAAVVVARRRDVRGAL